MLSTVYVRRAEAPDVLLIAEIRRQSLKALASGHYSEVSLSAFLDHSAGVEEALTASGRMLVAVEGERVIGCGAWTPAWSERPLSTLSAFRRQRAVVRCLHVSPDRVRLGVGRALLQALEGLATRHGARELELIATLNAEPMYRACGYATLGPAELEMGHGALRFRGVRMIKRTSDAPSAAAGGETRPSTAVAEAAR